MGGVPQNALHHDFGLSLTADRELANLAKLISSRVLEMHLSLLPALGLQVWAARLQFYFV